ncbi:hypothetical protein BH10ACI2_BH10ACI2_15500 [soil metagenome]
MAILLELEPDLMRRIRLKAASRGESIENFIAEVIDDNIPEENVEKPFYKTATMEEWEAALDSLAEFSDKIPLTWDDSRESIYGPREDAQL